MIFPRFIAQLFWLPQGQCWLAKVAGSLGLQENV
jgi:hypothetical protein